MTLRIGDTLVVCLFDAYLKSRDLLAQAIDFGAQAVAFNGFAGDLGD
jgi:hypothetical protein